MPTLDHSIDHRASNTFIKQNKNTVDALETIDNLWMMSLGDGNIIEKL